MPIKFRCPNCQQFLGISRAKAGLVTDCPTCGRTIRVPELDGSVKPLPKAELDLQDAELSHALAALAQIGDAPDSTGTATERTPSSAAPAAVALAPRREAAPIPLPEPIAIAASGPPPVALLEAEPPPASIRRSEKALAELASIPPPTRSSVTLKPQRSRLGPVQWIAAFGAGLLMFGAGFLVGRGTANPRESAATNQPSPTLAATSDPRPAGEAIPPAANPLPPEPTGALTPALTGRITYINSDGVSGPDGGARIVVLPEVREGSAKLAVVGFRAGASAADQQLSRTSLRALGGDYAIADVEGRYTIELPNAGAYHVLIMSRHQPRDDAGFLDANLQRILNDYFDRPASLIGPVAFHLAPYRFQGAAAAPRDHLFDR